MPTEAVSAGVSTNRRLSARRTPPVRLAVSEYAAYYHLERNHEGLGNGLTERPRGQSPDVGRVARRERLGSVLNYQYREAA